MTTSLRSRYWQLRLAAALAIVGAVGTVGDRGIAQIKPDATLGAERSVVTPQSPGSLVDEIKGGAVRGANLFHSFEQFSVLTGRTAYFKNALQIQNIISRVTGGSVSNIDGTLKANGTANVFLINPNGIIFGPNASLNIGGSFVGSTASSLKFADGTQFSATAPQTTPLLTISVPIGLQFGANPGSIVNQSQAKDSNGYRRVGLQVLPGNTLALVGGNVHLDGAYVSGGDVSLDFRYLGEALGGRVELGGVAGAGTVGLNFDGNNLRLSFPDEVMRADVSLTKGASVEGGDIQVQGRRITLSDGSRISSTALGSEPRGSLTVNGSESVELSGTSVFGQGSSLSATSEGIGGDLTIATGRLVVKDGSQVSAYSGTGPGGNLTVNASDSVELSGYPRDSAYYPASNLNTSSGGPEGGNLTINTGRLIVQNGAYVLAGSGFKSSAQQATLTQQGGALTVNASGSVELSGSKPSEYGGPSFLDTINFGAGIGGDLTIVTKRLSVRDGANVATSASLGAGKGGNINVFAPDSVELIGTSGGGSRSVGSLISNNGQFISGLSTDAYSIGNAGDINITTGRLLVQDGARVSASTSGSGAGGKLTVNAPKSVELIGTSADGQLRSGLFTESTVAPGALPGRGVATGNAGDLTIATGRLLVKDGAQVSASTFGPGQGGALIVTATDSVELIGTSVNGQLRSGLFTESTPLQGANAFIKFTGGLINRFGDAGNLRIATEQLSVRDRAQVSVSSQASGNAGTLDVTTRGLRLDNQTALTANSVTGKGGNIQLQATDLLVLRRNSLISAVSGQAGSNGIDGNINIGTKFLIAVPSENSDIVATGFGRSVGSNIQVNAQGFFGIQFQEFDTPMSDILATGKVTLNTPQVDPSRGLVALPAVVVDKSGLIAQSCAAGDGTTGSQFIVTGRGGLPPNPGEPLSSDAVWSDTRLLAATLKKHHSQTVSAPKPSTPAAVPIVPTTGWVFNGKGEVTLTASAPSDTIQIPWITPATCHAQ